LLNIWGQEVDREDGNRKVRSYVTAERRVEGIKHV